MNMKSILFIGMLCLCSLWSMAQIKNTSTEVIDYREVDGKIILTMVVNGVMADFVLDLAGHNAVLPEYLEKLNINPDEPGDFRYDKFLYKRVPVSGTVNIKTMALGNSIFVNDVAAFVLKDEPYLRKLGVAGIVESSLFAKTTLTIDSRRKKITISVPYRPTYMKLDHRTDIQLVSGNGIVCPVSLDGASYSLLLDTWNNETVVLNAADFTKLSGNPVSDVSLSVGYGDGKRVVPAKEVESAVFVKSGLGKIVVAEDTTLSRSIVGNGLLKHGLLSIDYVRNKVYFQPFDLVKVKDEVEMVPEVKIEPGKLNAITREYFLEHIFDYRKNEEFIYKGDKPVVIDFWATWCGPCMRLLPVMEKLAETYKDQVIFLKVNADKEKELCGMFNVVALPTLFFIPVGGKPIIEVGATPEKYVKIIETQLLNKQL